MASHIVNLIAKFRNLVKFILRNYRTQFLVSSGFTSGTCPPRHTRFEPRSPCLSALSGSSEERRGKCPTNSSRTIRIKRRIGSLRALSHSCVDDMTWWDAFDLWTFSQLGRELRGSMLTHVFQISPGHGGGCSPWRRNECLGLLEIKVDRTRGSFCVNAQSES